VRRNGFFSSAENSGGRGRNLLKCRPAGCGGAAAGRSIFL